MRLIGFSIGPVQSFIATARTTRDLWAGSYILSRLTECGIEKVSTELHGTIVFPVVPANKSCVACVPNLFVATLPDDARADATEYLVTEVHRVWKDKISHAVRSGLMQLWGTGWDDAWEFQIEHYFDIRCVAVPLEGDCGTKYARAYRNLMQVMAAHKVLRIVPPHEPCDENRPKCSLSGVHAVMGPRRSGYGALRGWWTRASDLSSRAGGARVKPGERLSAVSLVKRFAWSFSWKAEPGRELAALRFEDTATIAAAKWLLQHRIKPSEWNNPRWSGQWLHWPTPDAGSGTCAGHLEGRTSERDPGESPIPGALWSKIRDARDPEEGGGPAPAYYAALMMDGDNMGAHVNRAAGSMTGHQELSRMLSEFAAAHAPGIIENETLHCGQLVYAGGDDILAMLPASTVIACSDELRKKYETFMSSRAGGSYTMSAGIVVAHFKDDLRFTLEHARAAEREAKDAGRNRLCIRILKRSGEHGSAVCTWAAVEWLVGMRECFEKGDSDGWTHRLTASEHILRRLPAEAQRTEMERVLESAEGVSDALRSHARKLWDELANPTGGGDAAPGGATHKEDRMARFCFFARAASFLARKGVV